MARQWAVSGRAYPEYDEFGAIVSTTVSLASQNDGYATFTETLSGDHTRKTNDELITLAKNQYFKKEYADYAMQDAVIKVDELERSIKKSEVLQASLQTLINETKLQSSKNTEDIIAAENSRNAVFENIVNTINGYEQRLTNLIATTNSFMEEVFAMLTPEEVPDDVTTEGSTPE
jgi:predicted  nucleic acid-binding Zn-ribbon protein